MKFALITNIYLLICSGFGVCLGLSRVFGRKKTPSYMQFIIFAILSTFLSRLFSTLSIAVYGGIPDFFNIGLVGYITAFLFIFFANYGQIDWLIDDKDNGLKYRLVPAMIPIAEVCFALFALRYGRAHISVRVMFVVIAGITGLAGYYNIKHILVPDIDFGIVSSIRGFNFCAFLMGIFSVGEIGATVFGFNTIALGFQIVLGILYAVLIPILSREVAKWTR